MVRYGVRYGVFILSWKSDLCSDAAIVLLYVMLWYIV